MTQQGGAIGGGRYTSSNFGHSPTSIFNSPELQKAKNVLVVAEGDDGKPQLWSTGDERQAKELMQRASELVGINA